LKQKKSRQFSKEGLPSFFEAKKMQKIYIKFIATQLGLTVLMFVVWSLFGGIENAREMLFVITILSSAMAGNTLMNDAFSLGESGKVD